MYFSIIFHFFYLCYWEKPHGSYVFWRFVTWCLNCPLDKLIPMWNVPPYYWKYYVPWNLSLFEISLFLNIYLLTWLCWVLVEALQLSSDQYWHRVPFQFSSVPSLSCFWLFATPWTAACQASLSITNSWNLLKLVSLESVMPSNHLILCPFSSLLQSFPASGSFPNESVLHIRWPQYWNFIFSISPSNGYSGLISFRID